MRECCKPLSMPFTRWGLAIDPVGCHVIHGTDILEVMGTYRRETPSAIMLKVRRLNGETVPDIAASVVKILPRHYHDVDGVN